MKGVAGLRHGMLPKQQKATLLVIELAAAAAITLVPAWLSGSVLPGDGGTRLIQVGYVTAGVISQKSVRSLRLDGGLQQP
jgi:hypothetical protein